MIDRARVKIETTTSSLYFLPFLNEEIGLKHLDLLKNSYVYNNGEEKIFSVLYKFNASQDFLAYEEKLLDHKLSLGHEDYDEYVLYKFKIEPDLHDKLDILMNHNAAKGLSSLTDADQRIIVRFARRRLLPNADTIKQRLEGKFSISGFDEMSETFSNHVSNTKIVTANELYKIAKEAKG